MDKPEITDALLLDLAGERFFERGEDYYHRGAVEELSIRGDHVTVTGMGDADSCSSTMLVQVKWKDRSFSVPLSQLVLDEENDDEDTLQAIGDWEYWIESGRSF